MKSSGRPVRTALCLCGGGITGAMYEVGVLAALDDFFGATSGGPGFSVNEFDVFVGTSAGAILATLMAGGIRPRRLMRAILDDDRSFITVRRSDIFRFDTKQGIGIAHDVFKIFLSAVSRAARGDVSGLNELLTDLDDALPPGLFSLQHYEKFLDRSFKQLGLPERFCDYDRHLFVTANDLDSGHRVVFGEPPHTSLGVAKAICASSAIPIFFEPVRIDGRDFVDGAAGKVAHGDVALVRGARLMIVVNPLVPYRNDPFRSDEDLPTSLGGAHHHLRDKGLVAVYKQTFKMGTRAKLAQEVRRYRASHPDTDILLIEPDEAEGDMFLYNPMNFGSRRRMVIYGYESAARQLAAAREAYRAAGLELGLELGGGRMLEPWELAS